MPPSLDLHNHVHRGGMLSGDRSYWRPSPLDTHALCQTLCAVCGGVLHCDGLPARGAALARTPRRLLAADRGLAGSLRGAAARSRCARRAFDVLGRPSLQRGLPLSALGPLGRHTRSVHRQPSEWFPMSFGIRRGAHRRVFPALLPRRAPLLSRGRPLHLCGWAGVRGVRPRRQLREHRLRWWGARCLFPGRPGDLKGEQGQGCDVPAGLIYVFSGIKRRPLHGQRLLA
mmetsp:Transcript_15717/g.47120  ORF Transcript_15717/g.47120 Transcript_15717/m.47120 type:complete len:229 (-) Transcript_15717:542-1228(-)